MQYTMYTSYLCSTLNGQCSTNQTQQVAHLWEAQMLSYKLDFWEHLQLYMPLTVHDNVSFFLLRRWKLMMYKHQTPLQGNVFLSVMIVSIGVIVDADDTSWVPPLPATEAEK